MLEVVPEKNGANGGNAGNLLVNIQDGTNMNISFENRPGAVGTAGVRNSVSMVCNPAECASIPCYKGESEGVDGSSGSKGQVCLKMSAGKSMDCN